MKKLALILPLLLTACSDDKEKQIAQQQQQIQQLQMQQSAQQNYQPPQVIQAPAQPAAPVIINQQPSQQSDTGDTITNLAVGALAAHAISNALNDNSRDTHTIIKEKTVYVDRPVTQPVPVQTAQLQSNNAPQPAAPIQNKPVSSMNMNALSESAKQTTVAPQAKSSSMDMSKLKATSTVSLAKPTSAAPSKMNMSKLSRK